MNSALMLLLAGLVAYAQDGVDPRIGPDEAPAGDATEAPPADDAPTDEAAGPPGRGPDLSEISPVQELPPPPPVPAVAPVARAYDLARQAYEREDWELALARARKVQVLDRGHVGATLIEAGSLHRLKAWEASMEAFHEVQDDPGAGAQARKMIELYDSRWRRDQPSLSLGVTFRDDHAIEDKEWPAGITGELEAPLAGPLNLRIDFVSGWQTRGQLGVKGPMLGAMLVWQQPIGVWGIDAGAGPAMWLGRSSYWEQSYTGPFPAYRAALGGSVRPLRNLGVRFELGHAGGWGTKTLLTGFSGGVDGRLMLTGYIR
jgi:hypothetical protein